MQDTIFSDHVCCTSSDLDEVHMNRKMMLSRNWWHADCRNGDPIAHCVLHAVTVPGITGLALLLKLPQNSLDLVNVFMGA